ncbi:MAG: carbamate kinase, partial [Chloroflexota bacterium]
MTEKRKLAVVAVGGNALIRQKGKESLPEQYAAACITMPHIVDMIQNGWDVIVTHGNGPQVGFILRRSELSAHELHAIPLDYCGANTQGSIGYMFQTSLQNEFKRRGMPNQAATVVTQTPVDNNDPAFKNPTKPIGSFMDERTALHHRDAVGGDAVRQGA